MIKKLSMSNSRKIEAGERWLLMGTSGSGKTTAGKLLDKAIGRLYPEMNHYILDTQHMGDFDNYPGIVQSNRAPKASMIGQGKYQVWQPLLRYPTEIEKWLWDIFEVGPCILMIDELHVLKYKGVANYSDAYSVIQRAGRARKITSISHTQKLGKIPTDAYEQATHRLGFYMEGVYNKFIRSEMLKSERVPMPVDTYGFHYQHINGRGEPEYYRDIQQFLGIRKEYL